MDNRSDGLLRLKEPPLGLPRGGELLTIAASLQTPRQSGFAQRAHRLLHNSDRKTNSGSPCQQSPILNGKIICDDVDRQCHTPLEFP